MKIGLHIISLLLALAYADQTHATDLDALGTTHSVLTRDMNGDGLTDIVAVREHGEIDLYMRAANGGFDSRQVIMTDHGIFQSVGGIAITDTDDDGDLDIVGLGILTPPPTLSSRVFLLTNDGEGHFEEQETGLADDLEWQLTSTFMRPFVPTVANRNGQEVISFPAAYSCPNAPYTMQMRVVDILPDSDIGELSGGALSPLYADCVDQVGTDVYMVDVKAVDLNGDGTDEYLTRDNGLRIYDPITSEVTVIADVYPYLWPTSLNTIDIDNDGDVDILVDQYVFQPGMFNATERIALINDGSGVLTIDSALTDELEGIPGDIDHDGDDDLVHFGQTYLNDGQGHFTALGISAHDTQLYSSDVALSVGLSPIDTPFLVYFNRDGDAPLLSGLAYQEVNIGCSEDLDRDGEVSIDDFILFNSAYGESCDSCPEDLSSDGVVDVEDFLIMNSAFGESCE